MRFSVLLRLLLAVGFASTFSACSKSDGIEGTGISGGGSPRSSQLCVSSSCGQVQRLIAVPDAENILFAPSGRLFVTGGQNVYEITKNEDGSFSKRGLADRECGFTGMATRGNILYAIGCNMLFAGEMTNEPLLTPIFGFIGMCIPNGMVAGPDHHLYVVDEPLNVTAGCVPPNPKIVRLKFDPQNPLAPPTQETWVQGNVLGQLHLGLDNVLRFPNGIVRDGNIFYGTDGGSVYSVELKNDGSAGPVTPIFFEVAVHDDLGLTEDGILVTDFALGRISLWSRDGHLLEQTDPLTFIEPSSVRVGRPPMFKNTDVLVTEKGVITDNSLPIDYLSVFRANSE